MIKKLINKILRRFGYHLTKMPRPYQRKKKGPGPLEQIATRILHPMGDNRGDG